LPAAARQYLLHNARDYLNLWQRDSRGGDDGACGVEPTPHARNGGLVAVAADGLSERDGQVVARAAEPRMHRERAPEHPCRFAVAAERHVAEPGARERAEVMPVAR